MNNETFTAERTWAELNPLKEISPKSLKFADVVRMNKNPDLVFIVTGDMNDFKENTLKMYHPSRQEMTYLVNAMEIDPAYKCLELINPASTLYKKEVEKLKDAAILLSEQYGSMALAYSKSEKAVFIKETLPSAVRRAMSK